MARLPMDIENRGRIGRLVARYSRRRYGAVLDPAAALAHHPGVLLTYAGFETAAERSWTRLDPGLRILAVMAAAAAVECTWCMDFGYWVASGEGIDMRKAADVPRWRDSTVYTDLERAVMGYAEAMSATPPTVDDEAVTYLRDRLGDDRLVELTAHVALEGFRSRTNVALGLHSQGFRDSCPVVPVG